MVMKKRNKGREKILNKIKREMNQRFFLYKLRQIKSILSLKKQQQDIICTAYLNILLM